MSKKFFRSYYDHVRCYSNPGSILTDDYDFRTNDEGEKYLTIVGHTNIDEKIRSWEDVCDLKKMVARFNLGDENALNVIEGIYGDFKDMPTSYAELYKRINDCESVFAKLDKDVRAAFNNDPAQFWSAYGSMEFNEKIENIYKPFEDLDAEIKTMEEGVE